MCVCECEEEADEEEEEEAEEAEEEEEAAYRIETRTLHKVVGKKVMQPLSDIVVSDFKSDQRCSVRVLGSTSALTTRALSKRTT